MKKETSFFFIITVTLIIFNACAPTTGSMTLVDRSLPRKPRWTTDIPQSRVNEYFVGISDNQSSLEEAKKAAVVDALNDALNKRGIEISSKYEQLTTEQRRRLWDEVHVAGTAHLGLEQVTWYTEEWKHYQDRKYNHKFRAFVLMRSRKLKQDGFTKALLINLGHRFDATWHSALLPGWGQFKKGYTGKGYFFLISGACAAGTMGYLQFRYELNRADYRDLERDMKYIDADDPAIVNYQKAIEENKDERKVIESYLKTAIYSGLGIYFINLLDAFVFGVPSPDKFSTITFDTQIQYAGNETVRNYLIGLHVNW